MAASKSQIQIVSDGVLLHRLKEILKSEIQDLELDDSKIFLGEITFLESPIDSLEAPLSGKKIKSSLEILSITFTLAMGAEWIIEKVQNAAATSEYSQATSDSTEVGRVIQIIIDDSVVYEGSIKELTKNLE